MIFLGHCLDDRFSQIDHPLVCHARSDFSVAVILVAPTDGLERALVQPRELAIFEEFIFSRHDVESGVGVRERMPQQKLNKTRGR